MATGKRGVGLTHETLINRITQEVEGGVKENLLQRLQRLYGLSLTDGLGLLRRLRSAGILQDERRWRFAHDTFEEFFAARRLLSLAEQNNRLRQGEGAAAPA